MENNVFPLHSPHSLQTDSARVSDAGDVNIRLSSVEEEVARIKERQVNRKVHNKPMKNSSASETSSTDSNEGGIARSILSLRQVPRQPAGKPLQFPRTERATLNATARRVLVAPKLGYVFVTFLSYQIPAMHTLTEELRDEELRGGFPADDPNDETFMNASPNTNEQIQAYAAQPNEERATRSSPVNTNTPNRDGNGNHSGGGFLWIAGLTAGAIALALIIVTWYYVAHSTHRSAEVSQPVQFAPSPASPETPSAPLVVAQAPPPSSPEAKRPKQSPAAGFDAAQYDAATDAAEHDESKANAAFNNDNRNEISPEDEHANGGSTATRYEIQALATPNRTEAENAVEALKARGAHAFVSATMRNKTDFFRVRISGYTTKEEARAAAERFGIKAPWIEQVKNK